jgi:hypothetical protein
VRLVKVIIKAIHSAEHTPVVTQTTCHARFTYKYCERQHKIENIKHANLDQYFLTKMFLLLLLHLDAIIMPYYCHLLTILL